MGAGVEVGGGVGTWAEWLLHTRSLDVWGHVGFQWGQEPSRGSGTLWLGSLLSEGHFCSRVIVSLGCSLPLCVPSVQWGMGSGAL